MINELSEEEILDFLMTSDFNEGLNLDEFKFLLKKFRNFYRISSCNITIQKDLCEKAQNDLKNLKQECDYNISVKNQELEMAQEKYKKIIEKKLTWKERFLGKIIV